MRVTHVITWLGIGGAENFLCTLVESTRGTVGHTVVSLLPDGVLAGRLRAAGATVMALPGRRSFRTAMLLGKLAHILRHPAPDIVQGWMYHGNLAASSARLLARLRVPVIWGVRQTVARLGDETPKIAAAILAGSALGWQPAAIVYNSTAAARDHERLLYPASRRRILPNGIDCVRFRPRAEARQRLLERFGLDGDAFLVGRPGRNVAMKDNETLFAAFARAFRANRRLSLVLAGPGMTATDSGLVALARQAGVLARTRFLGPILDMESLYPCLDLVVSASKRTEGFPNVVAEAMASATPVLATDVGETGTIVADPRFIVPPGDPEALGTAILELSRLSGEARRQTGARLRQSIQARYDAATIGGRYIALWHAVMSRPVS